MRQRFFYDGPIGERDYEDGGHIFDSNPELDAAKAALAKARTLVAEQYQAAHVAFYSANKRRHNRGEEARCNFQLEKDANVSRLANRVIMLGGRA
jgi:hypothetical protein